MHSQKERVPSPDCSLYDHVTELESEIKNRQKTAKKISTKAASISDVKSKISSRIQKQTGSKPPLRDAMTASRKATGNLPKRLKDY